MSLASCSASMCVGRRSGYPFSGPRSRPNGLACNRQLINTVVGPPTLHQARMGPAPGHPNHQPGSGFGGAGTAKATRNLLVSAAAVTWCATMLISVGGGVCGRRPHSRWPTRQPVKHGVDAVASTSQRQAPAGVGRRTRTTPPASNGMATFSLRPDTQTPCQRAGLPRPSLESLLVYLPTINLWCWFSVGPSKRGPQCPSDQQR